jgi:hypothetical protein
VIVFLNSGKVQIRRKLALTAEMHLPQARAPLKAKRLKMPRSDKSYNRNVNMTSFSAIMMSRSPESWA